MATKFIELSDGLLVEVEAVDKIATSIKMGRITAVSKLLKFYPQAISFPGPHYHR